MGAQKAGTRLYNTLKRHREVFLTERVELLYFNKINCNDDIEKDPYASYFSNVQNQQNAVGDKTPSYLWTVDQSGEYCKPPQVHNTRIPQDVKTQVGGQRFSLRRSLRRFGEFIGQSASLYSRIEDLLSWAARWSVLLLLVGAPNGYAQVPLEAIEEFNRVVGSRVELAIILGGESSAEGGAYKTKLNDVDFSIFKLGGRGDIGDTRPLGKTGLHWNPVLGGTFASIDATNKFAANALLVGNEAKYSSTIVNLSGGARWHFIKGLSLGTLLGGTYGHVENSFSANTPLGDLVKSNPATARQVVDWNVHTWTFQPTADLRYQFAVRNTLLELISSYTYFHTEQFSSSSEVVNVDGNSHYWQNKIDIDIPLPLFLWNSQLRTGGNFSRSDLFGEVKNALPDDYFYTLHGRLVADVLGKEYWWKVKYIGLGGSYVWSDSLSGWSVGVDVTFKL
jgi:hypothetical protein